MRASRPAKSPMSVCCKCFCSYVYISHTPWSVCRDPTAALSVCAQRPAHTSSNRPDLGSHPALVAAQRNSLMRKPRGDSGHPSHAIAPGLVLPPPMFRVAAGMDLPSPPPTPSPPTSPPLSPPVQVRTDAETSSMETKLPRANLLEASSPHTSCSPACSRSEVQTDMPSQDSEAPTCSNTPRSFF